MTGTLAILFHVESTSTIDERRLESWRTFKAAQGSTPK
jgi:hypothetical protein